MALSINIILGRRISMLHLVPFKRFSFCCAISATLMAFSQPVHAADDRLFSLEDLKNLRITSVSKKSERAFDAPAAIQVITNEDMRRAGVTNVAEALRLASGLHVAQIDSNKWAVASRGFNAQLGEKILVLIDGRSVYEPTFSGVLWDIQDLVMEDLKRIEVIKGPGASLWGANAVNGVINIITKHSSETQGALVGTTYGNDHVGFTKVGRYGGKIDENSYYRLYAKQVSKGATTRIDGQSSGDAWEQYRTGFRADFDGTGADKLTLQGDVYFTEKDRRTVPISLTPVENNQKDNNNGGNLLARVTKKMNDGSESVFQAYYDLVRRDHVLLERTVHTVDLDFQNTRDLNDRNEFISGLGTRYMLSSIEGTEHHEFPSDKYSHYFYSGFMQNKYAVIPQELYLTLGSKLEFNNYTGFEFQPNARVSWHPTESQTAWAAVSRAVRTPSTGENFISLVVGTSTNTGGLQKNLGNQEIQSEDLLAYEVGYRIRPNADTLLDVAAFYNDYTNLRSLELSSVRVSGTDVLIPIANSGRADIYGFEVTGKWDVNRDWRLSSGYSFVVMDLDVDRQTDREEGRVPKNQVNLRSHYNFSPALELDNILYFTDNLPAFSIQSYARFDTQLTWRPDGLDGLELNLVGQNLLDDRHQEFSKPSNTALASEIGRTVYAKATWKF